MVTSRFGRFALLGKSRPVAQLRAQLRSTSRALWATQDSRVFHTEVSVCVTSGRTLCCYPTLLSRGRTASSGSCFQGYLGAALFRVVDPRGKVLSAVSAGPTAPGQSPPPFPLYPGSILAIWCYGLALEATPWPFEATPWPVGTTPWPFEAMPQPFVKFRWLASIFHLVTPKLPSSQIRSPEDRPELGQFKFKDANTANTSLGPTTKPGPPSHISLLGTSAREQKLSHFLQNFSYFV